MKKVLLISAGGSVEPLLFSIKSHQPDCIIFFASTSSVMQIEEKLLRKHTIKEYAFVITPDHQNLGSCLQVLYASVPEQMKQFVGDQQAWPQFVDYTGGTKTMSSALVWASMRHSCRFSYIGSSSGTGREKKGLGTVINGRELMLCTENPWNELLQHSLLEVVILFNTGRYSEASVIIESQLEKVDQQHHSSLYWFKQLCDLFNTWENNDYSQALSLMEQLITISIPTCTSNILPIDFLHLLQEIKALHPNLKRLALRLPTYSLAWDLLSTATRIYGREGRLYDAVVRILAAFETIISMEMEHYFATSPYLPLDEIPLSYRQSHGGSFLLTKIQGELMVYPTISQKVDILASFDNKLGLFISSQKGLKEQLFSVKSLSFLTQYATLETYYNELLNSFLTVTGTNTEVITNFPVIPV